MSNLDVMAEIAREALEKTRQAMDKAYDFNQMLKRSEVTWEGFAARFSEYQGDLASLTMASARLLLSLKEEIDKLKMI